MSTAEFCAAARARSADHRLAMDRCRGIPGQQISILREELDSMVRVIYLLALDTAGRDACLQRFEAGDRWPATDREMVELANGLHGWTRSVYRFGCSFIHLSRMAAYRTVDPLGLLPRDERDAILDHLQHYHGTPAGPDVTMNDLVPVLPRVFEKIAGNLAHYLSDLEAERPLRN